VLVVVFTLIRRAPRAELSASSEVGVTNAIAAIGLVGTRLKLTRCPRKRSQSIVFDSCKLIAGEQ